MSKRESDGGALRVPIIEDLDHNPLFKETRKLKRVNYTSRRVEAIDVVRAAPKRKKYSIDKT